MNREDFPLIMGSGNGMADCCMGGKWKRKPEGLIYLDNAATMQKPRRVIRAVQEFYEASNANPRRGTYDLAREATEMVEEARGKIAEFIGAAREEVIFTSGATEGLNMVASAISGSAGLAMGLSAEDEILVGRGEHHANLLPWGRVARETGAKLVMVKCREDGTVDEEDFYRKLTPNTRVVAMNLVGNVFGGVNEVAKLFRAAKERSGAARMGADGISGVICVLDAAQAVAHRKVDARELGADFMAFSGHKMGAPMGIGVLYGRRELLEEIEPVKVGGEMVEWVSASSGGFSAGGAFGRDGLFVKYAEVPQRFEAGTMNVGGIVGLKAAVEYLEEVGLRKIGEYERKLGDYAVERIMEVAGGSGGSGAGAGGSGSGGSGAGVETYGAENGMIALNVAGVHPQDTAEILNQEGIAVRAGWHCAQPMLEFLGIGPVVRVSLCFYNTEEEVEKLARVLSGVRGKMGMA